MDTATLIDATIYPNGVTDFRPGLPEWNGGYPGSAALGRSHNPNGVVARRGEVAGMDATPVGLGNETVVSRGSLHVIAATPG